MRIEHVAMYVNDLEAAKNFFEKYLGASANEGYHNKTTDFRSYFLTLNRTGLIHIAFSVGSKEKVDELTRQLADDDYEVISGPRTTGDGYYESCVVSIEENQIEITV